jgi:hypothetical protein
MNQGRVFTWDNLGLPRDAGASLSFVVTETLPFPVGINDLETLGSGWISKYRSKGHRAVDKRKNEVLHSDHVLAAT